MPAPPLVLVKFGGSLLTNKGAARPRFRAATANRLARELAQGLALAQGRGVLVHGAGSYGHPLALRHRVGRRTISASKAPHVLAQIQTRVGQLRARVVASCHRAHPAVLGLPLSTLATIRHGRLRLDAAWFQSLLPLDVLPVTSGDVLPDARRGVRVVGGDEILQHLAQALQPARVVLATDVPGLLLDGHLLLDVPARTVPRLLGKVRRGDDATGGMRGKLGHAHAIARRGIPVLLIDGRVPGRLRDAVAGRPVWGTRIRPH